jgi:hypothetical protein
MFMQAGCFNAKKALSRFGLPSKAGKVPGCFFGRPTSGKAVLQ